MSSGLLVVFRRGWWAVGEGAHEGTKGTKGENVGSHDGMERQGKGEMGAEELSAIVVDAAFHIHRELGPGLLESVYEVVLARSLTRCGVVVERQKAVSFEYDKMYFSEGLRIDLLVNDVLVVELKSVERFAPVHAKQLLTYLRLMQLPLGLLINFGAPTFKEGCKRVVNGPQTFVSSCLRVNQSFEREPGKHQDHEGHEATGEADEAH